MGKALYRSYRSRSFDEIVGQEHIVKILKNSLKNKAISHAYLLTGPRGVGKTSVARILAFAVNDLEYQEDIPHLDIIEIDAASNRRIDEVREIREQVRIAPTSAKYKVYIIDEVHMLTREAFNALLKTLEEPPAHAIFILATTEAHKVPETIVSRCIRLTFKPIEHTILAKHLATIAKAEGINITPEALKLLAHHGRGSFRDGISLLEQTAASGTKIEQSDVEHLLGIAPTEVIENIAQAIQTGTPLDLENTLQDAYRFGTSEAMLAGQISEKFRAMMISGAYGSFSASQLLDLQKELLKVSGSPRPRTELELILFGALFNHKAESPKVNPKPEKVINETSSPPTEESGDKSQEAIAEKHDPKLMTHDSSIVEKKTEINPKGKDTQKKVPKAPLEHDIWPDMLNALKKRNNTLYGVARMGDVEQTGNTLSIGFKFPFHYKQVNDTKNKAVFVEVLKEVSGGIGELEIKLVTTEKVEKKATPTNKDNNLESVTNIFGGGELLES